MRFEPHHLFHHRSAGFAQTHFVVAVFANEAIANSTEPARIFRWAERLDVGLVVAMVAGKRVHLLAEISRLSIPGMSIAPDTSQHYMVTFSGGIIMACSHACWSAGADQLRLWASR
jgi:hypothetical protein